MKILTVALVTALAVFAIATMVMEMLPLQDTTAIRTPPSRRSQSLAAADSPRTRRRPEVTDRDTDDDSPRPSRSKTKSQPSDTAETAAENQQSLEIRQQLRSLRQREAELAARQEAQRMIFDEIREEQESVAEARRRVSEEIAALRDATAVAQRETPLVRSPFAPTTTMPRDESRSASRDSPPRPRPTLSVSDSQSVRDAAILVRRLAEQGGFRAATSLLSALKDRDAAKVLSSVNNTDPQMALRLSEALQAARQLSIERQ